MIADKSPTRTCKPFFILIHPSIHPEKPKRLPEHLLGLIFGSGPFHLIAVTQRCVIFQFPLIPVCVTDPNLKTKLNLLSSAIMWRFTTVFSPPLLQLYGFLECLCLSHTCVLLLYLHTHTDLGPHYAGMCSISLDCLSVWILRCCTLAK